MIINFGINNAAHFKEVQYKTYYIKLINAIKAVSPDTIIIIQSVFPVTYEYSQSSSITNEIIDNINVWGKEIALEMGVAYLDTQSILRDENNGLIERFCVGDGIHLNAEAYELILKYISTHSIYQ